MCLIHKITWRGKCVTAVQLFQSFLPQKQLKVLMNQYLYIACKSCDPQSNLRSRLKRFAANRLRPDMIRTSWCKTLSFDILPWIDFRASFALICTTTVQRGLMLIIIHSYISDLWWYPGCWYTQWWGMTVCILIICWPLRCLRQACVEVYKAVFALADLSTSVKEGRKELTVGSWCRASFSGFLSRHWQDWWMSEDIFPGRQR